MKHSVKSNNNKVRLLNLLTLELNLLEDLVKVFKEM